MIRRSSCPLDSFQLHQKTQMIRFSFIDSMRKLGVTIKGVEVVAVVDYIASNGSTKRVALGFIQCSDRWVGEYDDADGFTGGLDVAEEAGFHSRGSMAM